MTLSSASRAVPVEHTRQRLITAARAEFAANGIAGGRVDRIAEMSGVNKQRIYAYFGSKERLFDAVVSQALDEMADAVPVTGPLDDYVGRVFEFHQNNPELLRLFLWDSLHHREEPLLNDEGRADLYRRKVEALAGILGTEPTSHTAGILLLVIGLAAWPLAVPPMTRLVLGVAGEHDVASVRDVAAEIVRRAFPAAIQP
jgi:AcrR family transcriptional regulator